MVACAAEADRYGPAATGTWAGMFLEWTSAAPTSDDDVIAEFVRIFGPLQPVVLGSNELKGTT